jgi:hypothetical protein
MGNKVMDDTVVAEWIESLNNLPKEEKLEILEDALHHLNFEKRLTKLTHAQLLHMTGSTLSIPQLERLNNCKTDEARKMVIEEYARAEYIRQCAWVDYLNGNGSVPVEDPN